MVRNTNTEYDTRPAYTKEEIEELTRYTFWESFGESLVTFGAYFMVFALIALTLYSLTI
jgi:hypothetical protein